MGRYIGNIITKNVTLPTTSAAKGIWSLDNIANYRASNIWPDSDVTTTYITNAINTSSLTQYTFSNIDVGTTGLIVVVIGTETPGTVAPVITSVTIGGTNASSVASFANSDIVSSTTSAMYSVNNLSGTISVVVNVQSAPSRLGIGVYKIENAISTTASATGTVGLTTAETSLSTTLNNLEVGSTIIAVYTHGDIYTFTWTGVTEDFEAPGLTNTGFSGASINNVSGNVTVSVSHVAGSGNQAVSLVAAAWR